MNRIILLSLIIISIPIGLLPQSSEEESINHAVNLPQFNAENIYSEIGKDFSVNPFNGALSIKQTDLFLPGRNKLNVDLSRYYNSKVVVQWGNTSAPQSDHNKKVRNTGLGLGWHISFPRYQYMPYGGYWAIVWHDGSVKRIVYDGNDRYTQNFIRVEEEGISPDNYYVLTTKEGIKYYLEQHIGTEINVWLTTKVIDTWGNYITIDYYTDSQYIQKITDTMGREIDFSLRVGDIETDIDNARYSHFLYSTGSDATDEIRVRFTYNGEDQLVGVYREKNQGGGEWDLIWKDEFVYDDASDDGINHYFELEKMKYSTGGSVEFTYGSYDFELATYDVSEGTNTSQYSRIIQNFTIKENNQSSSNTWSYYYSQNDGDPDNPGSGGYFYWSWTVVRDPLGNDIVYKFETIQGLLWAKSGLVREKRGYSGYYNSGILLKRSYRTYEIFRIGEVTDNGDWGYACWLQSEGVVDYDEDGQNPQMEVTLFREQTMTTHSVVFTGEENGYDKYGNCKKKYEYGEVSSLSATYNIGSSDADRYDVLNFVNVAGDERITENIFLHSYTIAPQYIYENILNKLHKQSLYNDSGDKMKETKFIYDEQIWTELQNYSDLPIQHDNVNNDLRGKVSKVSLWDPNRSPTWVDTEYKYDVCGNVVERIDSEGNSVYYSYEYDVSDPDKYEYAYLWRTTQNVGGVDIITKFEYSFYLGLIEEVIDENGISTFYKYDDNKRLRKVIKDGDSETYTTVEYAYTDYLDDSGKKWRIDVKKKEKNSGDRYFYPTWYFYDGLGRLVQTQHLKSYGEITQQLNTIASVSAMAWYEDGEDEEVVSFDLSNGEYYIYYSLFNENENGGSGYGEFFFDEGSSPSDPYKIYIKNDDPNNEITGTEIYNVVGGGGTYCLKAYAQKTSGGDLDDYYNVTGRIKNYENVYPSDLGMIVTDRQYDELGRTKRVSKLYDFVSSESNFGYYQAPDWLSHPYTEYGYDAMGRETLIVLPDNNQISKSYGADYVVAVDENQHKTKQVYDAYDNMVEEIRGYEGTNPGEVSTVYQYDMLGNLTWVVRPMLDEVEMQYNRLGQITYTNSPADMNSVSYLYDRKGQLRFQQDQIQKDNTNGNPRFAYFKYDEAGRKTSEGVVLNASYFTQSNADNPDFPDNISPGSSEYVEKVAYLYDTYAEDDGILPPPSGVNTDNPLTHLTQVKDELGYTQYFYDNRERASEKYANLTGLGGKLIKYDYNRQDQITSLTFPDASTVDFTYDKLGQLYAIPGYVSNLSGQGFVYDANSQLTKLYYNNSQHTFFSYDTRSRIRTINSPNDLLFDMRYTYENNSNLDYEERKKYIVIYDPLPRSRSMGSKPTEIFETATLLLTSPDANSTRKNINKLLTPEKASSISRNQLLFSLQGIPRMNDLHDNLITLFEVQQLDYSKESLENLLGKATPVSKVLTGVLASGTKNKHRKIVAKYLHRGNVVRKTEDYLLKTLKFTGEDVDVVFNILQPPETENLAKAYLKETLDLQNSVLIPEEEQVLTYLAQASVLNLASRARRKYVYKKEADYTYDELDRLTDVNYLWDSSQNRSFTYDKNGNRLTMNGTIYEYSDYNPSNNQLLGFNGNTTQFSYDANGNLTVDNIEDRKYVYDWKNRLKEVKANTWKVWYSISPGVFQVENEELSYYGANNTGGKYAKKYIAPILISGSNDTITFEFDFVRKQKVDMDKVVMRMEDSTAGTGFYAYYYYRKKDLVVRQYSPLNGTSDIYVDLNLYIPLDVWSNCKLVIDGVLGKVKFYFNGDLKSTVNLDPEIASVNSVKLIINEAHYHVDNISVSTTAFKPYIHEETFEDTFLDGLAGQYVTYYYNTNDERVMKVATGGVVRYITDGNGRVLAEYDGYGNLIYNYVYGNGQRLSRVDAAGAKEYYHNDYLGSARRITNSSGSVVWRRDYYPFGEERNASGIGNRYKFTGNREETETDMYHFGYRDLMSSLGRWNAVDLGWILHPNLSPYAYVANNPLRWVDILGLDWCYGCGPDGSDMYEFEIPVDAVGIYTGDDWGFIMELGGRQLGEWFDERFPLATENDPWFYQAFRGTGDIVTDVNNASMLMLGGTAFGIGAAVMSPAAAALYAQYGTVISAMGWKAAEFALWAQIVGPDKAGRFLNSAQMRATDIGYAASARYLYYKPQIDTFTRSVAGYVSQSPPGALGPTNSWLDFILAVSRLR